LQLFDLVRQPADLRLFQFLAAERLGLLGADLADLRQRLAPVLEATALELALGGGGGIDGGAHVVEDASFGGAAVAVARGAAHLRQDLLDDAADQIIGDLHGESLVTLFSCREDGSILDVDAVHDADDGGVHRQLLRLRRQAGAGALDDQYRLALAGPDRVHDDETAARPDEPVASRRIDPQRLDDQQLVPGHRPDPPRRAGAR